FDLLVTLGCLGVYELRAGSLLVGGPGSDAVTIAAKRAFGIGDTMLLERRAAAFAEAAGVPLAALDLGLENWDREENRLRLGLDAAVAPDPDAVAEIAAALGLEGA